jgi:hypothetical protein
MIVSQKEGSGWRGGGRIHTEDLTIRVCAVLLPIDRLLAFFLGSWLGEVRPRSESEELVNQRRGPSGELFSGAARPNNQLPAKAVARKERKDSRSSVSSCRSRRLSAGSLERNKPHFRHQGGRRRFGRSVVAELEDFKLPRTRAGATSNSIPIVVTLAEG